MYRGGGVPESGRKKFEKMPSGRYRYKNLLFQQGCNRQHCLGCSRSKRHFGDPPALAQ